MQFSVKLLQLHIFGKLLVLMNFYALQYFYPTALKGCRGIVFTHGVRIGGRVANLRCRKLILGRDTGFGGCRCATSWSDLDLTLA